MSSASVLGFSFWYPILLSVHVVHFGVALAVWEASQPREAVSCVLWLCYLSNTHFMPTSVPNPFFTDTVHNAKMADCEGCGGGKVEWGGGGGTYNYLKSQQIPSEVK